MYYRAVVAWWKDGPVPSLEERVAYLEGRTEEHAVAMGEVRGDIRELRAEMIRRFEHADRRFEQMDGRLHHMDTRFTWLIGVQFATLLAVIGALLGTSR
jgi:hypothetical protein